MVALGEPFVNRVRDSAHHLRAAAQSDYEILEQLNRDYIDSVQTYNRSLVTFPGNIVAGLFNFKEIPQLAAAGMSSLRVEVEENFGQWAICEVDLQAS